MAGRSGYVDAVVLCLAKDRKQIRHLEQVAKLLPKMQQLELASILP